ncbi:hypothetical protein MASR2M50_06600 [Thauera sp.]
MRAPDSFAKETARATVLSESAEPSVGTRMCLNMTYAPCGVSRSDYSEGMGLATIDRDQAVERSWQAQWESVKNQRDLR